MKYVDIYDDFAKKEVSKGKEENLMSFSEKEEKLNHQSATLFEMSNDKSKNSQNNISKQIILL